MTRPIEDQVVVVVGASSGIGRTTVRMLAERGAKVVAAARSAEDLESLVRETSGSSGSIRDMVVDVRDQLAMHQLAAATVQEFGRIDTWIGVAGVGVYGKAWEIPVAEYEEVMRTNWLGQVHGALASLPELRRGGGTLICVGSVESVRAVPLHAPYVSSKMALRGFCDSLRMDLQADKAGVAVTLVLPAAIDTPFFTHARNHMAAAAAPPPPVYAPESVAHAILRAAEHPRREVVVGGSGFGFVAGQKLWPRMTDRLMTTKDNMLRAQQAPGPGEPTDALDVPVPGSGEERGHYGGRPSLSALLTTARPVVRRAAAVTAAAGGLAVSRIARRQAPAGKVTPAQHQGTSPAEGPGKPWGVAASTTRDNRVRH